MALTKATQNVIAPITSTVSTTARTLENRFADIYNVKDFGAVGDGTTDNQAAFQAAVNAALAAGGGTIYIPKGTYWFSSMANSAKINVGNGNLTFKGDGNSSILKFAQPNFYSGSLFFNADNTPNKGDLTFQDLQIQGTLDTISGRYLAHPMYLWYFNSITIQNCKFKNIASASMIIEQCSSFKCLFSTFEDTAGDGARARDTLDCMVIGNKILRTGDDPIALHLTGGNYSLLKPNPQAERFIVSNNIVTNCSGGCVLVAGGRKSIITGNTFTLMRGLSISPSFGTDEGFRPIYDVTITGNSFTDICFASSTSSKTAQAIALFSNTKAGSSTNNIIPGDYNATTGAFVLPYNYSQSNTGVASESGPRTQNVNISNNSFSITRSGVSAFSDFGYGQRNSQGIYYNPAIPIDDLYANQIIGFYGQFENVNVSNNTIKDGEIGIGFYPYINAQAQDTPSRYLKNIIVSGNTMYNTRFMGISIDGNSGDQNNFDVTITDNIINCDPYRIFSASSNQNGTYSTSPWPAGIYMFDSNGIKVFNNTFKNCCSSIHWNSGVGETSYIDNNIGHCDPVVDGFSVNNKGIGNLRREHNWTYVIENSDPTSGTTYLNPKSVMRKTAFSIPTSGWYYAGWVVKNANAPFTLDANNMIVSGWLRLTNGSTHVLGVDWTRMYISTVSPAT